MSLHEDVSNKLRATLCQCSRGVGHPLVLCDDAFIYQIGTVSKNISEVNLSILQPAFVKWGDVIHPISFYSQLLLCICIWWQCRRGHCV
jgi:hypothetical protein